MADRPSDDQRTEESRRDFDLVQGFLSGDRNSRREFAKRLKAVARMAACLNRRMGFALAPDEVSDLAQDAVVIALGKAREFRRGIVLDAWLYRITSYELCNHVRRVRKRADRTAPFVEDSHPTEGEGVEDLERRERVLAALVRLHDNHAEVIRMHDFEGLSFADVGVRLAISENAAKGRYYRGLAELTALLQRDGLGGVA